MEPCAHCKKEIDIAKKGYTKVMLSRGGATVLSEVYLCGLCKKFVPYPVDCFHCRLPVPTDAAIPIVVRCSKDGRFSKDGGEDERAMVVFCSVKCQKELSRELFSQGSDTKRECNYCKKGERRMKKCSRCKLIRYCSRECQGADWIEHKSVCERFALATAK